MDRGLIGALAATDAARAVGSKQMDLRLQVPHCDLVLHTRAGYAFFRVIEPQADVVGRWREAQDEIARFISRLSRSGEDANAYLTLLIEGSPDPILLDRIRKNPYVCRKLVVRVTKQMTPQQLAERLPFFGLPERMLQAIRQPPADPVLATVGTRLAPEFVDQLLSRTAVETIADRMSELLTNAPVQVAGGDRPAGYFSEAARVSPRRLRVRELTLHGFRNYGKKKTFSLYGDLIVIYGYNGAGKTSICEAVEWALTGQSSRVAAYAMDHSVLIARGRESHRAEVTVALTTEGAEEKLVIQRTLDRAGEVRGRVNNRYLDDRKILQKLIHRADDETLPGVHDLRAILHSLHFLSQLELEQFLVETDGPYKAFARMAGTAEYRILLEKGDRLVAELRRRARDARAMRDSHQAQLDALEQSHRERQARLQILGAPGLEPAVLRKWRSEVLHRARGLGLTVSPPDDPRSTVAWRGAVQSLLSLVAARRESLAGVHQRLQRLLAEADSITATYQRRQQLQAEYDAAEHRRAELEKAQADLVRQAAATRDAIRELESAAESDRQQQERIERWHVLRARWAQLEASREVLAAKLAAARDAASQADADAARGAAALQDAEASLQRNQTVDNGYTQRLQALRQIAASLTDWRQSREDRDRITAELDTVRKRWRELSSEKALVEADLRECQARVARLQSELAEARRLAEERQELLSALQRHVHQSEQQCPLCGHDWQAPAALQAAVAAVGRLIPPVLQTAQQALDGATAQLAELAARDEQLKTALRNLQEQGSTLQQRVRELTHILTIADQTVAEWIPGSTPAGLTEAHIAREVIKAEENQSTHRRHMERLKKQISNLRAEAAQVAEQRRQAHETVRDLEGDLAQIQAELAQLEGSIREHADRLDLHADPEVAATNGTARRQREQRLAALRAEAHRLQTSAEQIAAELRLTLQHRDGTAGEIQTTLAGIARTEAELAELQVSIETGVPLVERLNGRRVEVEAAQGALIEFESELQRFAAALEALDLTEQVRETDLQRRTLLDERERLDREADQWELCAHQVKDVLANARRLRNERDAAHTELFHPTLNLLYQRLSPHPFFADLDVRTRDGKLHVGFFDSEQGGGLDGQRGEESAPVIGYFSQAQQVAVVLSIFLSAALLQGWTRLGTIFIDDPVQHMDDMNIFAFLDLLQGLVLADRQIIITTASEELYRTILGRFAHWSGDGTPRFQAIRLEGVTRNGPEVIEDTAPPSAAATGP